MPQAIPKRSAAWVWSGSSRCCNRVRRFEYTSGTRLRTPTGTMHGSYFFVAEDAERFEIDIPMFVLDALSASGGRPTLH